MTRRLALTLRPDGTLVELGADGDAASVARDVATDVEGCPGGLLAEARTCSRRRESSRLPWSCRAARDVAAEVIGEPELRLPARTRRMLHRHVAGTPYLEDREVFRIDLVGVPDPGEPAKPVLKGHRAVWDIQFIPVWQPVEESTLGSFREAAAAEDGPLALPFASLKARDWWAGATAGSGWPPSERASALERIAEALPGGIAGGAVVRGVQGGASVGCGARGVVLSCLDPRRRLGVVPSDVVRSRGGWLFAEGVVWSCVVVAFEVGG